MKLLRLLDELESAAEPYLTLAEAERAADRDLSSLIRAVIGETMHRFTQTLPGDGPAVEQLRAHLRGLARLVKEDQQLWTVMGELVLRAPRDPDLARIFRQTDAFWHRTLRDLLTRCSEHGAIDPTLDPDDTAALMIAAIKGVSLPTVAGFQPELADRVFGQLERLLKLKGH